MKLILVATLIAASAIAFDAQNEDMEHEAVLLEASASITNMKKKGATEADCKDLAKTSCKEVEKERKTDQKMIDRLKTGRQCIHLGQGGIRKATIHYQRTKKTHFSWKVKVTKALNYKVSFSSRAYSTLKPGRCGFIFGSRSFLSARARYNRYVKIEVSWRARVSESWKMVLRMRSIAKRMVKKCHCVTKKAYYSVWRTVTNARRVARMNRAYAKCKMMACILKGTPLTSSKCKGKLTSLRHKRLYSATAKVRGCKKRCPAITRQHCPYGRVYKNGCATSTCKKKRREEKKKPKISMAQCRAKSFIHYACSKCGRTGTGGTILSLSCPKKCGWSKWYNARSRGASSIVLSNCGKSAQLQVAQSSNGRHPKRYIYKSNFRGANNPRGWNVPKKSVVWNCGRLPNGRSQRGCLPTGNDNIKSMRFRCC